MSFTLRGRSRELGALRRALDAPLASQLQLCGLPGVGKTALIRHVVPAHGAIYHRAPPLPDPDQRESLARALAAAGHPASTDGGGTRATPSPAPGWGTPPSWDALFSALHLAVSPGRPPVLVVDDAHRWIESRARYAPALAGALTRARSEGKVFHVVLVSPEAPPTLPGDEHPGPTLRLRSLPLRAAASLLPQGSPHELLHAYAVFGGIPGTLAHLERGASLASNLRRLVLDEAGALADAPLRLLERLLQTPTRYAAILRALSSGEGGWGTVQAAVADLTASGQAAPYLKRLGELGMVETRRSLDAPAHTRNRRYRVTDPFLAFWYRFVLPLRSRPASPVEPATGPRILLPGPSRSELDHHTASVLPQLFRDFMTHDASEVMDANAREVGSLWGGGYEIPVAGVLASGPVFYGAPVPSRQDAPPGTPAGSTLAALDRSIRQTRFGFGRERRMRILFTLGDPDPVLVREAARRDDVVLVTAGDLVGTAG